jgi:hypothetical protein
MMGVDSQCLSYRIDALEGIEKPTDSLAEQRGHSPDPGLEIRKGLRPAER